MQRRRAKLRTKKIGEFFGLGAIRLVRSGMILKSLKLALVLLLAMDAPAAACHRFHVWRYPWPQRCDAPRSIRVALVRIAPRPSAVNEETPKKETPPPIPLPSLADAVYGAVWGAEPDESTRARLLRAALSLRAR